MTSRSIVGQTDFPDFDMLDAMIASALLRGRQIAHMIYEHFRATGAYEAVQRLSDLFTLSLQNDDVQDFDVRGSTSTVSE